MRETDSDRAIHPAIFSDFPLAGTPSPVAAMTLPPTPLRSPDPADALAGSEPGPTTRLVLRLADGEDLAVGLLWSRIHERVREMAARALRREGHEPSIEPTDVVGEVFMRLHGGRDVARPWESRGHFFGSIARAISQLLVDRARRRQATKRGGEAKRVPLEALVREGGLAAIGDEPSQVEAVHAALEALSAATPRAGEVAWLRFVIGLTTAQTAETLGISRRTVDLDWAFARAWLRARLLGEL